MSLQIRPADERDFAAIQAIYAHHVLHGTGTFELEPPDLPAMQERLRSLQAADYPCLVAVRADEVVGFGYAGPYRARPAYRYTVEDSIYLHPDVVRQGIGRQLLEALIVAARDRGFHQMVAVIGDSANHASIQVHRAAGFTLAGTLRDVGFKFERWLDTVMMQRSLRASPVPAP